MENLPSKISTGIIMNPKPKNKGNAARIIAALILSFTGITGSVQLLRLQLVSEPSFIALVAGSVLLGLIVAFIDRVLKFSFKELSVEFARVEAARQEVEEIAVSLAEISVFIAAFSHRMGSDEWYQLEKDWITSKVGQLLESMNTDSKTKERVLECLAITARVDALRESDDPSWPNEWNLLMKRIEDEVKGRR